MNEMNNGGNEFNNSNYENGYNQNTNNQPVNNSNNQPKNNNLLVIILLILILGLSGYIIWDKIIKKEKEPIKQGEKISENLISEGEALELGNNLYNKLMSFIEYLDGSKKDNVDSYDINDRYSFFKREEFLERFNSIFASSLTPNKVFREIDSTNLPLDDYEGDGNITYIVIDNNYYFDAACNASGLEVGDFTNLKADKIESEKVTLTYKYLNPYKLCETEEETVEPCYKNKEEYDEIVARENDNTLELVKENNTWKIRKVTFPGRCNSLQVVK